MLTGIFCHLHRSHLSLTHPCIPLSCTMSRGGLVALLDMDPGFCSRRGAGSHRMGGGGHAVPGHHTGQARKVRARPGLCRDCRARASGRVHERRVVRAALMRAVGGRTRHGRRGATDDQRSQHRQALAHGACAPAGSGRLRWLRAVPGRVVGRRAHPQSRRRGDPLPVLGHPLCVWVGGWVGGCVGGWVGGWV